MIAATADHGVHLGRDRDRRAAARSQSHQAVEAALQRADARRQVLPLYSHRAGSRRARRSPSTAARAARKGDYFGPFASVWAVNRALNALQRAFLLRSCAQSFYDNRTRPCLLYQIKRCAGPCTGEISIADYEELVARGASDFLTGKSRSVRERLAAEMTAGGGTAGVRARGAAARPHLGAVGHSGRAGDQSALGRRGRRLRHRQGRGALLHRGVLLPRLSELGQSRLFSARRRRAFRKRRCWRRFWRNFTASIPPRRCVLLSHKIEDRELLEDALYVRSCETARRGR